MTRLATATAIVLGVLLGALVVWQLREAVVLFLLSLAVAAAARTPIDYLTRNGMPKFVGLTGTYLIGLAGLGVLIVVTLGWVLGELQIAADDFVQLYEYIAETWPQGNWLEQAISRRLPAPDRLYQTLAGEQGASALGWILGNAFSVIGSFVNLIVIVVLSIYWTIDRIHFERLWLSLLPVRQRSAWRDVWRSLDAEIGAYFRAELMQSLLAGVLLWSGYQALGLRYPTVTAVVAAAALLLPWLGSPAAVAALLLLATPSVIMSGVAAPALVIGLAVLYTIAVLVWLELVVEPRLLNRRRYNSLLMALAVIALADSLGILGLLLGPPLAVTIQILAEHMLRRKMAQPAPRSEPPVADLADRLAAVRAGLAARPAPPPELLNLTDRLAGLIAEAPS